MDLENQRDSQRLSANMLMKRKRGRPRKYPRLEHSLGNQVNVPTHLNLSHEGWHAPPGHGKVNQYSLCQGNDVVIGQPVAGVVEATFDAGYLLAVKAGNSRGTLRGIVFKPGHVVPVSAGNDVAPNLPMIDRKNVHVPREKHDRVKRFRSRGHQHGAASLSDKEMQTEQVREWRKERAELVPAQSAQPKIASSHLVPVVLQPARLPQIPDKQAMAAALMPNASSLPKQVPQDESKVLQPPQQNNSRGKPLEALPNDLVKRVQMPQQQSSPEVETTESPLPIEPLQSVDTHLSHSTSTLKHLENHPFGKMTELLQVKNQRA